MTTGDRPLRGIVYINAALMIMATYEALIKYLTENYEPVQIAFIRMMVIAGLVAIVILATRRPHLFLTSRPILLVVRGLLTVTATVAFYYSLEFLALDDAVAISLSAPIFVAMFSGWILGERVPLVRWIAVLVGFAGVAIVFPPSTGLADVWALVALLSALCYALGMMVNRILTRTEDSLTILFYMTTVGGLVLLPLMPFVWKTTPLWEFFLLFVVGLMAGIAQYLVVQAYRYAAANTIITFDYIGVLYVAFVSYLVFAEIPSLNLVEGAALLAASGIFITFDEARLRRKLTEELGG